ncbi:PREDICTED: protein PET117 homolog, mitochondrial-like [Branchiostoma belcheri]|uniref:Protein PET117 homolog, mitochondrial-like n=1 Tax=Branchiostoma belcheri TaxID=7741 RepID=A0A6P5A2G6_BRABE|nr:PREDICTED: protein PET117 homolog, mitochondrial-like [Branchiostoma belcheri]
MSLPAKLFFGGCVVTSLGIIGYIHYSQVRDRERMRQGPVRDMEREARRRHNIRLQVEQIELTKKYEEERDRQTAGEEAGR